MATETLTEAKAGQAICLFGEIATLANTTRRLNALIASDEAYAIGKLIETIGWMADHGQKVLNNDEGAVGSPHDWILCNQSKGDANV